MNEQAGCIFATGIFNGAMNKISGNWINGTFNFYGYYQLPGYLRCGFTSRTTPLFRDKQSSRTTAHIWAGLFRNALKKCSQIITSLIHIESFIHSATDIFVPGGTANCKLNFWMYRKSDRY